MHGRWKFLLVGGMAIATFLLCLGRRTFATSHEARVAQVAREMAADGWPWDAEPLRVNRVHLVKTLGVLRMSPDYDAPPMRVNPWIVPILSGDIRLQKPPLPYWCAAILFRLTGVNEAAARIVPALLGALATILLFDLASLLYGRSVAWAAALIWPATYLVGDEYRLAMADPYLAFFTLAAVWAWVRAARRSSAEGLNLYTLRFYLFVALGALAKGPLIFLHVALPIVLFHVCFRERAPRGRVGHVLGAILFLAVALPWPLAVMHQVPNAMQLWRYESVGEVSGENQEGLRAWWYYLINLPLLAMPWVPVWVYSLVFPFRRKRPAVLFPLLWYGIAVLFFTVVGQKKLPYLLPIMPAQAIGIAVAVTPLERLARRGRRFSRFLVSAQAVVGIGWAMVLPVLIVHQHSAGPVALAVAGLAIVLAMWASVATRWRHGHDWLAFQSVSLVAVLLVFNNVVQTATANYRSPKPVCEELKVLAVQSHAAILLSRFPEEAAFYLPLHPDQSAAPRVYLVMVDDASGVNFRARRGLPELPTPDVEHFQGWVPDAKVESVRRVPMNTAMGDARWKVYALTVNRSAMALAMSVNAGFER